MKEILKLFRAGSIDDTEAVNMIMQLFYSSGEEFMLDLHRSERLGFPEVILAEGKTEMQVFDIIKRMAGHKLPVLVSNVSDSLADKIAEKYIDMPVKKAGRIFAIGEMPTLSWPGTVGIITAGTSDISYAKECMLILEAESIGSIASFDAGVAGIHRPYLSLNEVRDTDVLIILAGMEGALPTLVASLTDKPVIAVPTPVGYGIGGKGIGAMISMLQTCAPGVVTVNIGNTIGASAAAIRILRLLKRRLDEKV